MFLKVLVSGVLLSEAADVKPSRCTKCGNSDCFDPVPQQVQNLNYITTEGVVLAKRAAFKCTAQDCSQLVWQAPQDFIRARAWPASMSSSHLQTVVDVKVLQMWDLQKLRNPSISLMGFLAGIADGAAAQRPTQPRREINVHAFRCAHSEWKFCQMDLRFGLLRLNDLECPACSAGMAGVHIDSNMKLFTWKCGKEPWWQQHYSEFFADNASVQLSLQALDLAMSSRLVQQLKRKLQIMAEGMVSGNRSDQQQLLEKYADAVRARDAHALSAYTSTALLDSGIRRGLATRVIAGVWDANTYALHDLATKLVTAAQTSSVQAEAANQMIEPAVKASIFRMRNMIESACYNLKKQEVKRAAVAAQPKERKRCNKKCTEITKNLTKLVTQYNLLVEQYNAIPQQQQPLQPATVEAVRKQEFCWVSDCAAEEGSQLRLYGVARSIALCEADNEVQRIREELELLPREMTAHLCHLQQLLAKQGDDETALLAAQRLPADQCDAAASSLVAAG
ncbi:hypothetical protein OEZ86_004340 [Tetradesmus obliquus]|nr:hypothetical protein OEZ86_004340 [Tetradesmus obliquus]